MSLIQHGLREKLRLAALFEQVHDVKLFLHLLFASLEHLMLFKIVFFISPLSKAYKLTNVLNHDAEFVFEPPSINQIEEDLSNITLV